jgi:hypothetical protein
MSTHTRIGETPDGRRIEVAGEMRVPADQAWSLLIDTDRWPEWGPSVRSVETPSREISAGSSGTIETALGIEVPFEIVTCEPYRWTWRVARIPATGHRIDERGPDRCQVVFEVPLPAAWYVPVCRRALSQIETALR